MTLPQRNCGKSNVKVVSERTKLIIILFKTAQIV